MKHHFWFSYFLSTLLIGLFIAVVLWFFAPFIQGQKFLFYSPLPEFLTLAKNAQVSTINLFLPQVNKESVLGTQITSLTAKSVFIFDITTGQTIFAKNEKQKLPMASLTKVMTVVVALENKRADDKYIVTSRDLVGENSMYLTEGEVLTLEELLYGLMLVSANDAAETIAGNTFDDRDKFIIAMNDKAKALGLKDTQFTNPSGLQGDGDQYSTAYDLFVITNYAISKFPLFRKIVQTVSYEIPQTDKHKAYFLENETNLLTSYPGVKGVKTGYTPEAGLCLVTYLEYKGHKFIGVILGSNNRRDEMRELLDYALEKEGLVKSDAR